MNDLIPLDDSPRDEDGYVRLLPSDIFEHFGQTLVADVPADKLACRLPFAGTMYQVARGSREVHRVVVRDSKVHFRVLARGTRRWREVNALVRFRGADESGAAPFKTIEGCLTS